MVPGRAFNVFTVSNAAKCREQFDRDMSNTVVRVLYWYRAANNLS